MHVEFEPYGTLVSCDARFYIQYLHWVLDRNHTHRLGSRIANWSHFRMFHRDTCGDDMNKETGRYIFKVYWFFYHIQVDEADGVQ